jgi:hypothetical protein
MFEEKRSSRRIVQVQHLRHTCTLDQGAVSGNGCTSLRWMVRAHLLTSRGTGEAWALTHAGYDFSDFMFVMTLALVLIFLAVPAVFKDNLKGDNTNKFANPDLDKQKDEL